jgi:hypothetical protein
MLYIYFNAFWDRFFDETSPVNFKFFIDLFSKVFEQEIKIGSFENSQILCESVFGRQLIHDKKWDYTFIYSGESTCKTGDYSAILMQDRSYKNIIHGPLFILYMYNKQFTFDNISDTIPTKNICTLITNPHGETRNLFINIAEKYFNIDHLGPYRNNVGYNISGDYGSNSVIQKLKEYKFIICFENSQKDAYITEKIINPFIANIVPIYWGCKRIQSYFNKDRYINLDGVSEEDMHKCISNINTIIHDENKYKQIIKEPIYNSNNINISIDTITDDIKRLIFSDIPSLHKIVFEFNIITNPQFKNILDKNNISNYMTNYNIIPDIRIAHSIFNNNLDFFYYNLYSIFHYYKEGNFLLISNILDYQEIVIKYKNYIHNIDNFEGCFYFDDDSINLDNETIINEYKTNNFIISYNRIKSLITYLNTIEPKFIEKYTNLVD